MELLICETVALVLVLCGELDHIQNSYMTCIVHTARIINEIDILAVRRRHVIHQPCIQPSSSGILGSSMVRASNRCTEGHRFNSCWRLRLIMLIMPFLIIACHYALQKETKTLLLLPHTPLLHYAPLICVLFMCSQAQKVISFNSTLFLFSGSSEMNWHLLIMLESALKASPSNHHLKLLLMRVYCSMGE